MRVEILLLCSCFRILTNKSINQVLFQTENVHSKSVIIVKAIVIKNDEKQK